MGRDTLSCKHDFKPIYEDHVLMGSMYYGKECKKCRTVVDNGPGPLDLGTYR